jgi:predicted DNA-binding protein
MAKAITIRLTEEQAAQLDNRKKRTLVPTEAFVRSLIEQALKAEKIKP